MVFDTMVLAYALFGVPRFREEAAAAIEAAPEILVPDSFFPEFANVAWKWVRAKHLPASAGFEALEDARSLVTRAVPTPVLWKEALRLSVDLNHPLYDTLFVALAADTGRRLLTYDGKLLARFPETALQVGAFLRDPARFLRK